jgi:hypothetical protein
LFTFLAVESLKTDESLLVLIKIFAQSDLLECSDIPDFADLDLLFTLPLTD